MDNDAKLAKKLSSEDSYFDIAKFPTRNSTISFLLSNWYIQCAYKFLIFNLILIGIWIAKVYGVNSIRIACINDPVHNVTEFLNHAVNNNIVLAKCLQISSSFLMDFSFFVMLIYWYFDKLYWFCLGQYMKEPQEPRWQLMAFIC